MKRLVLFLLMALVVASLGAAPVLRDIRTRGGAVYLRAEVTRVTATGISISYADGVAFLEFYDLSPELQKEFGYDPKQYLAAKRDEVQAALDANRDRVIADQQRIIAARDMEAARLKAEAIRLQQQKQAAEDAAKAAAYQDRNYTDRGYGANPYVNRSYEGGYTSPSGSSSSTGGGSGGPVHVGGYFRKDGTYVHSYTRKR